MVLDYFSLIFQWQNKTCSENQLSSFFVSWSKLLIFHQNHCLAGQLENLSPFLDLLSEILFNKYFLFLKSGMIFFICAQISQFNIC